MMGCQSWIEQAQFLRAESEYLTEPDPDDRYGVRQMNRREEARWMDAEDTRC